MSGKLTLISGGSKCGKSSLAESLFSDFSGEKFYIATMIPSGEEAFSSIERHRINRAGKGFVTIEKYRDIGEISLTKGCGVLVECLGNLLANEMFFGGEIKFPNEKITDGIMHLKNISDRIVIVTNDVSRDGILYDETTEMYKKNLSELNRKIAEIADCVTECVFGIPLVRKGNLR